MAKPTTLEGVKKDLANGRPVRCLSDGYEVTLWCWFPDYNENADQHGSLPEVVARAVKTEVEKLGGVVFVEQSKE
jgi:hypothetical protein